ncbi:unnamed protein product [Arabis nemorensis]|uniref:Pectate lyase superfamily protein domain-containing protein n=1 Tax=Arabis nemorensis TaxID=586526 RepID=A0A565C2T5_9BRAS|nr:unnamed protein product [Arabis nemorensis]
MEIILRAVLLLILLYIGLVNGQIYDVLEFGAKGDGITDDSEAFMEAWKAMCGCDGTPKTLLIPSNSTFLLQPLVFQGPCKSPFVLVRINGEIVAPINKDAWSNYKSLRWIHFKEITGLTIIGSGTINGRGSSFWKPKLSASKRPTQLHFQKCINLMIIGITSVNSPKNHISINQCENVNIKRIKLVAPHDSPNTDGIDISRSSDVNIFDSKIGTGDDCVAINNGSVNIKITRINCGPGHGISVGSLGRDGEESVVENVQVIDCTFNRTDNGARIKTWPNGKGYAKNIVFKGIKLTETQNPIIINQKYVDKGRLDVEESAVAISNVTFTDICGTSRGDEIVKLDCSEVTYCKDIVLEHIDISTVDGKKPLVECTNVYGKSSNASEIEGCFTG